MSPPPRRSSVVTMSDAPDATRVSDDDRDRVAALLRDAVGRGQLSLTEVDDRLRAAYAAITRADLSAVTADLPQAARPSRSAPGATATAPASTRGVEWRPWIGAAVLFLAIWAATSLAAGHALFFWPAIPIGIWGFALLSSATGTGPRSGPGCRSVSARRS
jgi:uncharacterized protein DUF1707